MPALEQHQKRPPSVVSPLPKFRPGPLSDVTSRQDAVDAPIEALEIG